MLFIGIPTYNEATTIGVLLWRLRTVLADVSREYEVVVYDDASTDETTAVLEPYTRVLPLTLLRGAKRLGTGGAIDAIVRHVARTTRYPRRDGLLLMQGDFTDSPALVPEFLRRFEGGADLIIGERASAGDAPLPVRRLFTASRWVLRPFVGISDVRDLTSSFRLARITVLRDLLKASGETPVASGDAWLAQADFLLRAAPHARRVETIPVTPTFGVRTRDTRRTAWPDTLALAKWGWSHRGQRIAAKVIARTVEAPVEVAEPVESPEVERPERPERRERVPDTVEKRGKRERGGERRERDERKDGRSEARDAAPRPARAKRTLIPPATDAEGIEPVAEPEELSEAPAESAESERAPRKRRRGKRGVKRAGEPSERFASDDEPAVPADSAPSPQRDEPASDAASGDALPEDGPDGEREPKRRRARRGRRKRGDGGTGERLAVEAGEGEARDGAARDGDAHESAPPRGDAREREVRSDAGHERPADGDRDDAPHAEGEAGQEANPRRRNRRGRRGGRRRSGNGGGEPGSADHGESGEAGPSEHPPTD